MHKAEKNEEKNIKHSDKLFPLDRKFHQKAGYSRERGVKGNHKNPLLIIWSQEKLSSFFFWTFEIKWRRKVHPLLGADDDDDDISFSIQWLSCFLKRKANQSNEKPRAWILFVALLDPQTGLMFK